MGLPNPVPTCPLAPIVLEEGRVKIEAMK
ncbi:hypothetical protein CCACVL1_25633 [Corchorus capsularis]|uniref:Uncharacterized protein n=1 Tax=Corchorus capsularis TaxID=210143 RepID=A0A1R3GIS9_COCAP|nr:hypothetical protein CCACVL1_25633 [Corchorus capsularis]